MQLKKMLGILVVIAYLFTTQSAVAQQKRLLKRKKSQSIHLVAHYGNLGGVGLGCQYEILRRIHIEILGGIEAPGYIVWASPFTGHQYNFHGRLKLNAISSIFVNAGWYYASFKLTKDMDELDFPLYYRGFFPTVSLGFQFFKRKMSFEVGAAFNIPKSVSESHTKHLTKYTVEAERSVQNFGKIFPFFMLRYER